MFIHENIIITILCLWRAHHQAILIKTNHIQRSRLRIPQSRRRRRKLPAIALVQRTHLITRYSWDLARSRNWYAHIPGVRLSPHPGWRRSGRDGHDPAGRTCSRAIGRDADERWEVRVTCDDERATRVEHDIIGRERGRHARAERQRLRGDVPRVEENLAERGGRDRYERSVGGDRDAVWEGDA